MNTALVIIGLSMLIFLVVFYLKRAKEKRKAWLEEREKIKEYGESINEETSNRNHEKTFSDLGSGFRFNYMKWFSTR